jgi:hypothetical protein
MDSIQDSLIVLELAESVRLKIENGKYYAALKVIIITGIDMYTHRAHYSANYRFWIACKPNT